MYKERYYFSSILKKYEKKILKWFSKLFISNSLNKKVKIYTEKENIILNSYTRIHSS